jgi:hypothetical protein
MTWQQEHEVELANLRSRLAACTDPTERLDLELLIDHPVRTEAEYHRWAAELFAHECPAVPDDEPAWPATANPRPTLAEWRHLVELLKQSRRGPLGETG